MTINIRTSGLLLLFLTVFSTAFAGCGGGGSSAPPSIGIAGGTVTSADRSATLTFPPSALGHDVVVTITSTSPHVTTPALDTTGAPAYRIAFSGTEGRAAHLHRAPGDGTITFQATYPAGFDTTNGVVYAARSDIAQPIPLQSTFDPQSGTMATQIPPALLHAKWDGTEYDPGDYSTVSTLTIGLAQSPSVTVVSPPLARCLFTSGGGRPGSFVADDWQRLNGVSGKRIAVVVPGTWNTCSDYNPLGSFLSGLKFASDEDTIPYFDYVVGANYDTTNKPPDQTGQELANVLTPLLQNGNRIYLFSHSQGGLVSRYAIEKGGASGATMLVMLGTPNEGIPADAVNAGGVANGTSIHASALQAMHSDSAFLRNLNGTPFKGSTNYYTVVGSVTVTETDANAHWENVTQLFLQGGASDGVVYLSSASGSHIPLDQFGKMPSGHQILMHVVHSNLPLIDINIDDHGVPEKQTLSTWIRNQDFGGGNFNIH